MSPGLKLLLAGEEEPQSTVSIDIPTGSLRHSRHSSICSRLSTKKGNTRSPLTNEAFKETPKEIKDNNSSATVKQDAKKESSVEQTESSVGDSTPPEKGNIKRKESFLKRLFSRKRSSTSVPQSPPLPAKKKYLSKKNEDSKTSSKQNASLQEKIEFHQTALSVEVFDDDLPAINEEKQQASAAMASSSLYNTTVEISAIPDSAGQVSIDDDNQAAVKTIAESVAENVVKQALLVIENDINNSIRAENSDSLLHNEASLVETVMVRFKKVDKDDDSSSESNESNTSDNDMGIIQPMDVEEFEKFCEDVSKPQNYQSTNTGLFNATPDNQPLYSLTFDQPTNGIPSTVVRAIHKDLQILSESIDQDLNKLANENQEQEEDLQKTDEDISSSVSNIAMEKLEEAQVIPHTPLLQSTPSVTPEPLIVQKEDASHSTSLVKRLNSNFSERNHTHASNTATGIATATNTSTIVKRLSGKFVETAAEKNVSTNSSFEERAIRRSSSTQERMKMFGEKITEIIIPIGPLQSSSVDQKSQQGDTKPPEVNKVEEPDLVTPLMAISSASLRRSSLTSVDKLKLEGLKAEAQEQPLSLEGKKQKWRMSPLEFSNKPGSPVTGRRFLGPGSPLSSHRLSFKKHDPESLGQFMNPTSLDHLTELHEKAMDNAKALAIKITEALLEDATLNERTAPDAFRRLVSQENNKFVWCVKDTWYSWLELINELPLECDSEECYILLHVRMLIETLQ